MTAEVTLALQPTLNPAEARHSRAQAVQVGAWLDSVWSDEPDLPAFTWNTLSSLPGWAMGTPAELERLALLTGALFAAPALRVCLDAGPLLRVRALIGAQALDRVLAVPGLPAHGPVWPTDENGERATLYAWGAALLITCVSEPMLQLSLARVLSFPVEESGLLPASLAVRMVSLARHILDTPHAEFPSPKEKAA